MRVRAVSESSQHLSHGFKTRLRPNLLLHVTELDECWLWVASARISRWGHSGWLCAKMGKGAHARESRSRAQLGPPPRLHHQPFSAAILGGLQ